MIPKLSDNPSELFSETERVRGAARCLLGWFEEGWTVPMIAEWWGLTEAVVEWWLAIARLPDPGKGSTPSEFISPSEPTKEVRARLYANFLKMRFSQRSPCAPLGGDG